MFKSFKVYLLILFSASLLLACGDSDVSQDKSTVSKSEPTAVQLPAETPDLSVVEVVEEAAAETEMVETASVEMTEEASQKAANSIAEAKAAAEAQAAEAKAVAEAKVAEAKVAAEAKIAEAKAAANITAIADASPRATEATGDKPYQVVDGKISANAMEGWKTYNGGGCGTCHGKGAIGAVGPELGKSLTTKLSKADFVNIVTKGVSGTMMRPHNTNKRVMANLDNLYAYLLARGDGVLGPENLIKSPLGK